VIDWRKPRTCFSGTVFMPEQYNQAYCCRGHQRIWDISGRSKFGRKLRKDDPQAALYHYRHLM